MAYKVKYRLDYCNKEKLNARLDFEIKDYTSTIIHDIVGTQNAFSYKVRNEKPDRSGYFRTLEADINIFEDENFNIDNLLTSDETAIRVKFYIEGQIEFVGFIIPDFFEVSIDKPRVISMVASDRIGTLKNQTLPRQTGVQSFRYMIEQSLLKTGLDLTINSTINFNPIGESGDFLTNTGGLMERLSSDKGASISCYDIIKSILIVSNSLLVQANGQWHILNKLEFESRATTKNIEQINIGGRRLINPPSSKVGVMAEFGGGMKNPINYNFKSLDGWTSYNGFNAELTNKEVAGYSGNNPVYGDSTINNSLIVSTPLNNNIYIESDAIKATVKGRRINFSVDVNFTTQAGKDVFYQVVARKGSDELYLNSNGSFVGYASFGINLVLLRVEAPDGDANSAVVASQSVDGTLVLEDDEVVSDWSFHIRHYRLSSNDPIHLVNHSSVTFITEGEQKGNLYKIEQGVNFTKESEIDTTVFGGYINKGVNGYFYNYQRDELNQIYYKIGSRWESFGLKWQTANNNTADYLLLHSVRQRAIMFSDAHNIITAVIKGKFSPLDIYDVCGVKYVLVEANYDFYRNETELRIEEVKYDNSVLKTDFIYSYFGGEDTTSISGVSSVGSSSGGGGSSFQSLIKIDDDGNYYVEENFYSLKDVSAFGKNDLGDGGNGDGVALTSWIDQITTLTDFNQNTKFIKQSEVVDNLTSNLSNLPLSARQGMILKNFIDNIEVGEGGQVVVDWDSILGKPSTFAPSAHSHIISDVTDLQVALDAKTSKSYVDDGLATKENTFSKNTAFNRNFGTTAGTVASGNHTHKFSEITDTPTTLSGYGITDGAKSVDVDAHITDKENPHSVTKTQVGLSNVTNDKQATKTEFDTFKNLFDSLFELDGDYIKAKKSLYSTGDLSAFGKDNLGGGGTGGGTDLVSWVDQITTLTDFNQSTNFINIQQVEAKGYATNTRVDGISGRLTTVESNYTTQSDIDSAINELEIGGRNLIYGGFTNGQWNQASIGSNDSGNRGRTKEVLPIEEGKKHIFSMKEGTAISPNRAWLTFRNADETWHSVIIINELPFTFVAPAPKFTLSYNAAIYTTVNGGDVLKGRLPKLERGTKATDWTPAPEDQVSNWNQSNENSFDFIKNKPTKLSQFSNVETDFTSKSYVENNFVDLVSAQTVGGVKSFTDNTNFSKAVRITGESGYSEGIRLRGHSNLASIWFNAPSDNGYDAGMFGISHNKGTGLRFRGGASSASDLMRIMDNGNVGIGTTTPTSRLDVNGVIKANGGNSTNWNDSYSTVNSHIGDTTLHKTQSDRDAIASFLSMFELDGDFIKAKHSLYSVGDLSAFGKDNLGGGGSSGGTDLVSWVDQITTLTDFNQSTNFINIQQVEAKDYATNTRVDGINSRLTSVEGGSVMTVTTSGSGNAITSISKSGTVITATKGDSFSKVGHTHAISDITNLQTELNSKASNTTVNGINSRLTTVESNYTTQSDIDNAIDGIEIGGRNLIYGGFTNGQWNQASIGSNDDGSRGRTVEVIKLETGKQYTFSILPDAYIRVNGVWITFRNADNTYHSVLIKSDRAFTFTAPAPLCTISYDASGVTSYWGGDYFRDALPKLEKGNKATDWTPAPEDQIADWFSTNVNAFDFIKNKPTKLSQFSNVETDFTSKTYVTTELNKKVDKVSGKSLISDSEISRLSTVTNQTATSIGLGNVTNESKATMFANPTFTGTVSGVTKSMVGLSNVDNVKQATKSEFDNFVALRNNPHEVTKAQVGLTNVTNVLQASKSEFDARVLVVDNHINDKTNPHAVTKKQVGLEFATNESKATMFTDPTFTGTTKVTILELNTNWKFVKVGNNIELQYNGVTKQEMTSDGHIIAHGDVTALLDN